MINISAYRCIVKAGRIELPGFTWIYPDYRMARWFWVGGQEGQEGREGLDEYGLHDLRSDIRD